MIDHDRIFKELIKTFFLEFIELFFPELSAELDPSSVEFLDKEVFTDVTEGEKHAADLVVKARLRGQASFFLFHVESQAQSRELKNFKRRMFVYFARLHEEHSLPVYPIALFTFASPKAPPESEYRIEFPGWTVLSYNFRVIQLNRLHWRDFLKHENPVACALMAKMQMTKAERKQVKFECLRLMLTLKIDPARMQLIAGFVDTYLRLPRQEERWVDRKMETLDPQQRRKYMEVVTRWEEKALAKGVGQGVAQEAQSLVLRLAKRRFGAALSARLEARIRRLTVAQLEALGEALFDFKQLAELRQWLAQVEAKSSGPKN